MAALEKALGLWQDLQRRIPDKLDYQWEAARTESCLADNYKLFNRYDEAVRAFRHAIDVHRLL